MATQKTANFFAQIFSGIPDLENEEKTRMKDNSISRGMDLGDPAVLRSLRKINIKIHKICFLG